MKSELYRKDIQGLRAIAIIFVLAFHYDPSWLPGGFIGVDIFFVISGFLITTILLQKKSRPDYDFVRTLKHFYTSRIKRIFPAYFTMLVIVAIFASVLFTTKDFEELIDSFNAAIYFNSNNYFSEFGDYFSVENYEQPLLHTWSLAVEIQFYLLAPFFVLLVKRRWLKWVFAVLVVVLTILAEYNLRILGIEQATYFAFYARLPEFYSGCLVAIYLFESGTKNEQLSRVIGVIGLFLLIISALLQTKFGLFPGVLSLLPVIGSSLLLAYPVKGRIGRALESKPFLWLGDVSFSLYLWHWPVLAFLRYYSGSEFLDMKLSFIYVFSTISLSVVSYYVIERSFRNKRTTRKQIVLCGFLLFGLFSASQATASINKFLTPKELTIEYRRYADPNTICHGKHVGDCIVGEVSSERSVLVLGDSHAAMLNLFFEYLGKELSFNSRVITASSCITIERFDIDYIAEKARRACSNQIKLASSFLDDYSDIILAGMWSYQLLSEKNSKALINFVKSNQDKKIYILEQVPELRVNPIRHERFNNLGLRIMNGYESSWYDYNQEIKRILKDFSNVKFIENKVFYVNGDIPFYKGELLYFDESHLNERGSLIYAQMMRGEIDRVLLKDNE